MVVIVTFTKTFTFLFFVSIFQSKLNVIYFLGVMYALSTSQPILIRL